MPHLIGSIHNQSMQQSISQLTEAHDYLVKAAIASISQVIPTEVVWGQNMKRLDVMLSPVGKPTIVLKEFERLTEIINIVATCERMIDALSWFSASATYNRCMVMMCHPSTSDDLEGNDIVLGLSDQRVLVRCEVCDVVSSNPGQNKKERNSLAKLGALDGFPKDNVDRFLCTSADWADGLTNRHRHWQNLHYRYLRHKATSGSSTFLLELQPAATS